MSGANVTYYDTETGDMKTDHLDAMDMCGLLSDTVMKRHYVLGWCSGKVISVDKIFDYVRIEDIIEALNRFVKCVLYDEYADKIKERSLRRGIPAEDIFNKVVLNKYAVKNDFGILSITDKSLLKDSWRAMFIRREAKYDVTEVDEQLKQYIIDKLVGEYGILGIFVKSNDTSINNYIVKDYNASDNIVNLIDANTGAEFHCSIEWCKDKVDRVLNIQCRSKNYKRYLDIRGLVSDYQIYEEDMVGANVWSDITSQDTPPADMGECIEDKTIGDMLNCDRYIDTHYTREYLPLEREARKIAKIKYK